MYYSQNEEFVFESERSVNKELFIDYDIKSMASDCKPLDDLVSKLFIKCEIAGLNTTKMPAKRLTAEVRLKRNLRSVLWHLFKAQRCGRDYYVRIRLANDAFTGGIDRNPHKISREVREIVHLLDKHGVIQKHIGFLDQTSKYTRIRATFEFLNELRSLPAALKEQHVERPAVIFRKNVKVKRNYRCRKTGTDKTIVEKKTLEVPKPFEHKAFDAAHDIVSRLNIALQNHDLNISPEIQDHFTLDCVKSGLGKVDFDKKSVCAIFYLDSDGCVSYGRMHRGWWQSIPSKFRPFITIDGKPTVELDYSAQVLNMAASHSKVQLIGDPYVVDLGVSCLDAETQRKIVKSCVVVMINTKSKIAAMQAAKKKIEEDELWTSDVMELNCKFIYGFFDRIFAHHPFLKRYAFKSLGKMFFFHDAQVARRIIDIFLENGKVVLPIHDGFVALKEDANSLRHAMEQAWFETFETIIGIKME